MHPELPFADALGPARVIHVHQPQLGLAGTVVIDNLACGPAIGVCAWSPTSRSPSVPAWRAP